MRFVGCSYVGCPACPATSKVNPFAPVAQVKRVPFRPWERGEAEVKIRLAGVRDFVRYEPIQNLLFGRGAGGKGRPTRIPSETQQLPFPTSLSDTYRQTFFLLSRDRSQHLVFQRPAFLILSGRYLVFGSVLVDLAAYLLAKLSTKRPMAAQRWHQ